MEYEFMTIDTPMPPSMPLPRYSIIDRYVQLGGRRVVLGSDAHISVKLGNAFSSVVRKLPNTCVIGYFKNRVFYEL